MKPCLWYDNFISSGIWIHCDITRPVLFSLICFRMGKEQDRTCLSRRERLYSTYLLIKYISAYVPFGVFTVNIPSKVKFWHFVFALFHLLIEPTTDLHKINPQSICRLLTVFDYILKRDSLSISITCFMEF